MTATVLQKKLIKKISETENMSVLKEVNAILKANELNPKLSQVQIKMLQIAENDIKEKNITEHGIAMKKIGDKYGW